VAIETNEITIISSGRKRDVVRGGLVLKSMPFMKGVLKEFEGTESTRLLENIVVKISP
jgi:hypothetical protein